MMKQAVCQAENVFPYALKPLWYNDLWESLSLLFQKRSEQERVIPTQSDPFPRKTGENGPTEPDCGDHWGLDARFS
ncbi:MAG TPA: hypothetical protein VJ932_01120 [Alkalispirochaeta sp.]|nr:hypothetical protein [Alkalispirochaeta sp.]